jgi:hypothetical protein
MKKVLLIAVFTFVYLVMYTGCVPETLTNEGETEEISIDPADDGTIDD